MGASAIKKISIALGALLVLALIFIAALPWIASTQIVRDRIAYELSFWSGYRVSLGEAPEFSVWPVFRANLSDVTFHEWAAPSAPPVLEADEIAVSLSAFAALRGKIVLSTITMHRPLLRLDASKSNFEFPASPGGGRMARAIETTRRLIADNPSGPDIANLPADAFATVEFSDGRIVLVNGKEHEEITQLNGRINWPALNRNAQMNATGVWQNENIIVEATASAPLLLIAGASSALKFTFKSGIVETSFDGTANLSGDTYFDGQATFSSPSMQKLLDWSNLPAASVAPAEPFSVASTVQGNAKRLRLDSATITFGQNSGRGVLDLAVVGDQPSVSGTLAFDKVDLQAFLSAFVPLISGTGSIYDKIDVGFGEYLALDMRFSAVSATLGNIVFSDVAATAQVQNGLATFDVFDATAFNGDMQAGLRIDMTGQQKSVEMRLMANNVDAQALAKAAGSERLTPQGRANISIILKGNGNDWNTAMGNAEGSVSASMGQGSLGGIDLAKFRQRWQAGDFFSLSEVGDGSLPLRNLDFKAKVVGGVARIEKADLMLDAQEVLSIDGIIPYFGRALALSGHFSTVTPEGVISDEVELPFFIGGAWDSPFIAPVITSPEQDWDQ